MDNGNAINLKAINNSWEMETKDEYSDIASQPAPSLSHNTILTKLKEMWDKGDVKNPEFMRLVRVFETRFKQEITIGMLDMIGDLNEGLNEKEKTVVNCPYCFKNSDNCECSDADVSYDIGDK